MEDNFSTDGAGVDRDGFWMIQVHYIYCALYSSYYYISSTSDHQALDPGGWGCLEWRVGRCRGEVPTKIRETCSAEEHHLLRTNCWLHLPSFSTSASGMEPMNLHLKQVLRCCRCWQSNWEPLPYAVISQVSRTDFTWGPVKTAESQASQQAQWDRICILTRFLNNSHMHWSLRSTPTTCQLYALQYILHSVPWNF